LPQIEQAHEHVTQPMSDNRVKLDAVANALLEHETLEQEEAYAAAGIDAPTEPVSNGSPNAVAVEIPGVT
jgi:cell division protease FtsH